MSFLPRWLGSGKSEPPPPEHAVIVRLVISGEEFGTPEERTAIHQLADAMERRVQDSKAGMYDGDEFGAGECTLYFYGPDANALFATIEPELRASPLAKGGQATKRFGAAGDPGARKEIIRLES